MVHSIDFYPFKKCIHHAGRRLVLSFDHLSKSFMKCHSLYAQASSLRFRSVHNLPKKCICVQRKCLTSRLDVPAFKRGPNSPLPSSLNNSVGMCVVLKLNRHHHLQYYKELCFKNYKNAHL